MKTQIMVGKKRKRINFKRKWFNDFRSFLLFSIIEANVLTLLCLISVVSYLKNTFYTYNIEHNWLLKEGFSL